MAWTLEVWGEEINMPDVGDKVVEVETGAVFVCVKIVTVETAMGDVDYVAHLAGPEPREAHQSEFDDDHTTYRVKGEDDAE